MRLLLDTHILLWWLADDARLGRPRNQAIESSLAAGERLGASIITF